MKKLGLDILYNTALILLKLDLADPLWKLLFICMEWNIVVYSTVRLLCCSVEIMTRELRRENSILKAASYAPLDQSNQTSI